VILGRREQVWLDAQKLQNRQQLNCRPQDLPALLADAYSHPLWQQKADACFSCGSCVMVCPSCYCFDVQDDLDWDLAGGTRQRQWDGCLLCEFALVAGGHNFRKHRAERYRHRFYRKARYLPERFGFVGCVGCGRCANACTAGIANPVEVYNALLEDRDEHADAQ
jgi:ferredoxin